MTRRHLLYVSTLSLAGIGLGLGEVYAETKRIEVTRLNMDIGSKIAFLADTHIHGFGEVEDRLVDLIKDEAPDVVMLGGDIIDEFTVDMETVSKYISSLEGREKFAVLGNHDYWSGKAGEVARILEDCHFNVLHDATVQSSVGKVYGLEWRENRRYPPLETQGIVIVHDPNSASNILGKCLVLSGHTHGGIVVADLSLYSNSIYTRGLYGLEESGVLYVSRGLGQMIPFRPTSPLELVIVE